MHRKWKVITMKWSYYDNVWRKWRGITRLQQEAEEEEEEQEEEEQVICSSGVGVVFITPVIRPEGRHMHMQEVVEG